MYVYTRKTRVVIQEVGSRTTYEQRTRDQPGEIAQKLDRHSAVNRGTYQYHPAHRAHWWLEEWNWTMWAIPTDSGRKKRRISHLSK